MESNSNNTAGSNPAEISKPSAPKSSGSGCIWRLAEIFALIFLIWWADNFLLFRTQETIKSSKIKNDIKISVISDLHASTSVFAISNERIIKKINGFSPDVVCVLGDMHSSDADDKEKDISMRLMKGLVAEGYKVFFVLGEHDDRSSYYINKMEKNGIDVLDQRSERIKIGETDVTFYGISNAWFSDEFDLNDDFKLNEDTYNVLLAHIPKFESYERFGADLTLCADTHGGIIRLPFIGPAYLDGKVFPKLFSDEKIYDKGMFKYKNGYMFITSGIGNYPVPARFLNFPEVGEITIKAEKSKKKD